jgi:hypothetical protein
MIAEEHFKMLCLLFYYSYFQGFRPWTCSNYRDSHSTQIYKELLGCNIISSHLISSQDLSKHVTAQKDAGIHP